MQTYNKVKRFKLISAIAIDLIGLSSYFIPAIGEAGDIAWAPISGVLIYLLFPNRKKMAFLGAIEEALPFTDILPTALLAWWQEYKQGA